jgi:hypothetical protein
VSPTAAVSRPAPPRARRVAPWAVAAVGAALLAGCGAPPEPLPTAPPRPAGSGSVAPSGGAYPTGTPGTTYPTGGLPTQTYPYPTYPLPTTTPTTSRPTTSPTRSLPPAAPRCTEGPSRQQVLDLIEEDPGIPDRKQPVVTEGPFCAGVWHFSVVGSAVADPEGDEPLLVVTRGKPASLTLVVAGTDVCTEQVEDDAPPGIRVRACGF